MAASLQSHSQHARCWTRTDRITQLVVLSGCLICYLGVGSIAHALFLGPDIGWNSSLSLVVIFGWPVVAFSWAALLGSIAGTVVFWILVLIPGSLPHIVAPVLLREWSRWMR